MSRALCLAGKTALVASTSSAESNGSGLLLIGSMRLARLLL
jgi:hypothetical protein